ncbi:SatD family protein [Rhodohalobacter sp. 8-1]|uniref:SatD family protein n=1 Tax=Rhodohalobacter sp. 8-1 TaxID=3131972 RepID=UPI0030EDC57E
MNQHIVLIGDLIGSKELNDKERERYQSILVEETNRINRESSSVVSPLTITLGDEFQAVYKDLSAVLADSWSILAALYPVGVRFSIGVGQIYTEINSEQALGMDGPAFHAARDGMDLIKESGRLYNVSLGSPADQPDASLSLISLVNYSLQFLSNEIKQWKKTRLQILVMLQEGESVKKIAEEIGISESAVYKNREDGDLNLALEMKESIGENINRIL